MRALFYSVNNSFKFFLKSKSITSFLNFIPARIDFKGESIYIYKSKIVGNLLIEANVKIYSAFLSGNVEIGRYTSISGPVTSILSSGTGKVLIGSFCSIARGVQIQEYNHKFDRTSTYYFGQNIFNKNRESDIDSKGDIIIEDDVWIGANSIILSGVKIGRGAIIAAGSVVNKDVAAYSIVAGVPAKEIKKRFCIETIQELEKTEWWKWTYEQIMENEEFFLKNRL